jgi:hypothetical protein
LVLLDIVLESAPQPVARPKAVPVAAPKVIEAPAAVEPQPEPIQDVIEQPESVEFDGSAEKLWAQLLGSIKQHHNTLYSVLRMAVPQYDGETLTLICGFPFHQKRLSEAKNKQTIADIIQQITGNTVTVTCIVQKGAKAPEVVLETPVTPPVVVATTTSESSPLEAISNIFGSVEMLE